MMKKIFNCCIVLSATAFLMTACNTTPAAEKAAEPQKEVLDEAAMTKIVSEHNKAYGDAFVAGDSVKIMDHFTDDIRLLPTNSEQVIGKAATAQLVSAFLKFGIKKFTDETTRVIGMGDYIVEEGNYFLGGDKDVVLDKGKYICVWRKEKDDWRVCSNMWNTSLPAPAAEKK